MRHASYCGATVTRSAGTPPAPAALTPRTQLRRHAHQVREATEVIPHLVDNDAGALLALIGPHQAPRFVQVRNERLLPEPTGRPQPLRLGDIGPPMRAVPQVRAVVLHHPGDVGAVGGQCSKWWTRARIRARPGRLGKTMSDMDFVMEVLQIILCFLADFVVLVTYAYTLPYLRYRY